MIAWIIGLLIVLWIVQRYTLEHSSDSLEYHLRTEKHLVEPDEIFDVYTSISNKKWLFIPYLCIRSELPEQMTVYEMSQGKEERREGVYQRSWMETKLYLSAWQKAEITQKVSLAQRGCYYLLKTTLELGDFLGVSSQSIPAGETKEVVVLPRRTINPDIETVLGGFLGDVSVRRFWMEDPMFVSGFREYTGREPFRAISWTQSARNHQLMVKEYEYTAELSCLVLLDISCHNAWEKDLDEKIEECFRITRMVCETLEKKGFSYEFRTNAVIMGPMGNVRQVLEGRGTQHLLEILELLGRASSHFQEHLEDMLVQIENRRSEGKSCILISLEEAESCLNAISRLRHQTGYEVLTLHPDSVTKSCDSDRKVCDSDTKSYDSDSKACDSDIKS